MNVNQILAGCVLSQGGKPIAGEPVADNVAVRPIAGGQFVHTDGTQVVAALMAAYPKCRFLWLATPVSPATPATPAPPADKKSSEKK